MKTIIKVLRTVLLYIPFMASSQNKAEGLANKNRIYLCSHDVVDTACYSSVVKIKEPWGKLGRYIVTLDKNGEVTKYKKTAIWGYRRSTDAGTKRVFNNETYMVKDTSPIILYLRCVKTSSYFFSKSFDTPIFELTRKNLLKNLSEAEIIRAYQHSTLVRQIIE